MAMISSKKTDELVRSEGSNMRLAAASTLCILLICPVVFLVSEYMEWRRTIRLMNEVNARDDNGYGNNQKIYVRGLA